MRLFTTMYIRAVNRDRIKMKFASTILRILDSDVDVGSGASNDIYDLGVGIIRVHILYFHFSEGPSASNRRLCTP